MQATARLQTLILLFLFVALPACLLAQEGGIDERFRQAREAAYAERYEEARRLCRGILEEVPDYHGVRVFLGRTYAWEERFGEARAILEEVLERSPGNRDALGVLGDVAYWSGDYAEAVRLMNRALDLYPGDPGLMDRRIRALVAMQRYEEAGRAFARLQQVAPDYEDMGRLREMVGTLRFVNGLRAGWGYGRYSELFEPTHNVFLQYRRETGMGPLLARLRLQRRFGKNGLQGELDWYPVFGEGFYGYLSYAWSGSVLFPEHRAGAEFYHRLLPFLEGSLGARLLLLDDGESVTLLTGSLAAYAGNYYLSLKPFLVPSSTGLDRSAVFTVRRYLGGAESYLWVTGSMGVTPAERTYQQVDAGVFRLESWGASAGLRQDLGGPVNVEVSVDYEHQERLDSPGRFLDIFTFNAQLAYRF